MSIDKALILALLGAGLGEPKSWAVWLSALKGAFGIALNRAERGLFASVAGDRKPPQQRVRELWCAVPRRAGKSSLAREQKMPHSVSGSSRNICSCANTTCLQKHRLSRDQLQLADFGANVAFRYWGYVTRYCLKIAFDRF
jgi:hypothetical protein